MRYAAPPRWNWLEPRGAKSPAPTAATRCRALELGWADAPPPSAGLLPSSLAGADSAEPRSVARRAAPIDHGLGIANYRSVTRAYRSNLREGQARRTRGAIVDAATRRFTCTGYAATTVRAVADEAGVSVPSVEAAFGSKARLLRSAIDRAIAGDDEPVAMLDREFAHRARAAATATEALTIVAGVLAASQQRSAGLVLAAFEGAASDLDLAALAEEMVVQRRATATWIVDLVAAKRPLRVSHAASVETLWTLMDSAVFDRVTRRLDWSPERYQHWFADAALHLLTPDPTRQEHPMPDHQPPVPGALCYLQLPTTDLRASLDFYSAVLGWEAEEEHGSFTAPGLIGQWTTDRPPTSEVGPLLWWWTDGLYATLTRVVDHGGRVLERPQPDQGARWLVDIEDPCGNRLGLVCPMRTGRPQPLLMCRDVAGHQPLVPGAVAAGQRPRWARTTSAFSQTANWCCSCTTPRSSTITAGLVTPLPRSATARWSGSGRSATSTRWSSESPSARGARRTRRSPEPARGQRARPPRDLDHRPRGLHRGRRQP